MLFEHLGLPTRKKTKTGYSTSAEVLESLRGKHEIIDAILEYRKVAKLKSTYVDGLLKVVGKDGRIHTHFNQADTRTGRLSSTEPNLQNIPVRTELGSRCAPSLRPKSGCELVDADYSQIELRVLAHISGDQHMIEAFNSDEDIHTKTASQVFKMPLNFVTPEMRRRARRSTSASSTASGRSRSRRTSASRCRRPTSISRTTWRPTAGCGSTWRTRWNLPRRTATSPPCLAAGGRCRRSRPATRTSSISASGVAMNTPIQGTAADIIKIAMIRVYRRLMQENLSAQLILQVHDELIVEAPEHEGGAGGAAAEGGDGEGRLAQGAAEGDVGVGKTWIDANRRHDAAPNSRAGLLLSGGLTFSRRSLASGCARRYDAAPNSRQAEPAPNSRAGLLLSGG